MNRIAKVVVVVAMIAVVMCSGCRAVKGVFGGIRDVAGYVFDGINVPD